MKITGRIALAALSAALCFGTGSVVAQQPPGGGQDRPGRGNFDPEQFRQRMMDRYREQLEIKDDGEWKLISTRIEKVTEARREVGFGGPMGGFGRGGGRRGGGGGADGGGTGTAGGDNAGAPPPPPGGQDGGQRRRGFGGDQSPEREALQQALDSKASADDLKAKLAKYRESRKAKEAKLEKAQDELRQVLTARQEAAAVLAGLLN